MNSRHRGRSGTGNARACLDKADVLELCAGLAPLIGRLSDDMISDSLRRAVNAPHVSHSEILDVRRAIEVRVAELAARNRTDTSAQALRLAATAMTESCRSRRRFIEADLWFHETLYGSSGNPFFALAGRVIRSELEVTIAAGFDSRRTVSDLVRVAQIHVEIADAVIEQSVTRAFAAMDLHFQEAAASLARVENGSRQKTV